MRRHLVSLLVGILWLGVSVTTIDVANATTGEMIITSDTTLTQDHQGNIVIDADDVTLDCAGHSIIGPPDPDPLEDYGVLVSGHSEARIANCDIRGFLIPVRVEDSTGVEVASNTLRGWSAALEVSWSSQVDVFDNVALGDGDGVVIPGIDIRYSTQVQVSSNQAAGYYFNYEVIGSSDVSMVDNHAAVTDKYGVGFLLDESSGITMRGNSVRAGPEGISFDIREVSNSTFDTNWAAPYGSQPGFWVSGSGNVFRNNFAHFYVWAGFVDETVGSGTSGTANTYVDNVCIENPQGTSGGGSRPLGLCDVAGSFADDELNTFELSIEWMAWKGITKGCDPPANLRYCPGDRVTRGQMAAFLHRALRDVLTPTRQVEFVDDDDSVFESDIEWLGGTGVTKGCNPPANDHFCPDDYVTRGQMAAFLVRAMGYTDDGGGDLFIDDDESVFEGDIDRLGTAGVTKGCNPPTNTRFCPTSFVTRGQMAAFLQRALD